MMSASVVVLTNIALHTSVVSSHFFSYNALEWPNASSWCQTHCNSESEYASALNTLDNNPYVYTRVWTGLNDINITDIWEWSDGSPFDYGNITDPLSTQNYLLKGNGPWRSDEPDYNDSDNAVAIEVGSKYASRYNSRSWVDRQPEANYQFMCNSCSSKLHKYVAVNNARNYSDARSICQQYLGTDLASIHSDADFEEVKFTCKQISASAGCWIGLNDIAAGGRQFEWTDGTDWDYGTTLNQWPWFESEPKGTNQFCIFLDPSNGGDIGEYQWDDYWCYYKEPKTLCNAPSEICLGDQWLIPDGNRLDWSWSTKPCKLTKNKMEEGNIGVIANKQWSNPDGTLLVDMMLKVTGTSTLGNVGMIFYVDDTLCDSYYYIGVWPDDTVLADGTTTSTLRIANYKDSKWTVLASNSMATFRNDSWYTLKVTLSGGTRWTVTFDNTEIINLEDATLSDIGNAGNTLSPYIGIRNVNTKFEVKQLYVSGDVQYGDTSWYSPCTSSPTAAPSIPTISPTLGPTDYPSVNPTVSPTDLPTEDTISPTLSPTTVPTVSPSLDPTVSPTDNPTRLPTEDTLSPSLDPTYDPTYDPTFDPTTDPTLQPTTPTTDPTKFPTSDPTKDPTSEPTVNPTAFPTEEPTYQPTSVPTTEPTPFPTLDYLIRRNYSLALNADFDQFERYTKGNVTRQRRMGEEIIKIGLGLKANPSLENVGLSIFEVRRGSVIVDYGMETNNEELMNMAVSNMNDSIGSSVTIGNMTFDFLSNSLIVPSEIAVYEGDQLFGNEGDTYNRNLWWLMVLPTLAICIVVGFFGLYKKGWRPNLKKDFPRRKMADHSQCHSTTMTHNQSGSGWIVDDLAVDLEAADTMNMDSDLEEDCVMMVAPTVKHDIVTDDEELNGQVMSGSVPKNTLLAPQREDGGNKYGGITQVDDDEEDEMMDEDLEEDYIDLESNGVDADPLNGSPMITGKNGPRIKESPQRKVSGNTAGRVPEIGGDNARMS